MVADSKVVDTGERDTGKVDTCDWGQHEIQTRNMLEKEGPEEKAQPKVENKGAKNHAQYMTSPRAA